ncbi:MAG TPA: PAS domain S-box protein [Steroidobacteraceae bacterium]|nr:PAS domain S-box protein [Steroidobacteraceae bacterium]
MKLSRNVLGTLLVLVILSAALFAVGHRDYPNLHLILDTGMCLLSGLLALLLRDLGARAKSPFPIWVAISFGIAFLAELVHVLVTIDWSGPFALIAQSQAVLRPATWPIAGFILPLGVGYSIWLLSRGRQRAPWLAPALILGSAGLFAVFISLPRYTPPGVLGITRPTLILVPPLWALISLACWLRRSAERILPALALMAAVLVLAHCSMLYSRAPHDTAAMIAHLGKIAALLILLLALMEMAASDMLERIRAEQQFAQLNEELERRIVDRTAELHLSYERMRAIVDTALDGLVTMNHEGRIVEFNPAAERIFGLSRGDAIGQTLADTIIPPAWREQHSRGLARYLATGEAAVFGKRIELTGQRADGTLLPVELSINRMPGEGPPLFAGFIRDITERRRQEALRARYAAIVESSDDGIMSKTLQGVITSWNRGAEQLFGYSAAESIGRPMLMLFPKELRDEETEILAKIARGESVDHFETVRVRKDGTYIDVAVTISPIRDAQGKVIGASKIARDISERKRAEQSQLMQLARLELLGQITRAIGQRLDLPSILQVVIRSLEDDLPIDFGCVFLHDSGTELLTVVSVGLGSEALAMELGLPEKARIAVDQNGLARCVSGKLVYEPDIDQLAFPFPQQLARGGLRAMVAAPLLVESKVFGVLIAARRAPHSFSSGECEFLRQLSEHVALAANQAEIHGALQRAYDDLRQTQQAVLQQERLRALGEMASGIAHDINNALSPMALYTDALLEREKQLSARSRGYLQVIQRAIDDVAQTVARMREFYRHRDPQLALAPIQMNRLVEQVIDLTRARWSDIPQQIGVVIQIERDLLTELPDFMGVESEVRDALTNLMFNAIDAMPAGGVMTLRTGSAPDDAGIYVEVCDTGIGMDEDTRLHCLEPFFTTKGERGTGLGLAMVYGMVQRHSADIDIRSMDGIGTTVRLSFSRRSASTPLASESAAPLPSLPRLRILVVDDDPLLLKSLRDILEGDGHEVTTANGGQDGIDFFRADLQRGAAFAVVISDLGMPYVDGRKVASAIKDLSPSTPVILLTGWGQRLIAEGEVPAHVDRVLGKPPKLNQLREALRVATNLTHV